MSEGDYLVYGDETGRGLSRARLNVDSDQAFRSDMNWNDVNGPLLAHFRRLGQIRKDNPVIALGRQRTLDAHTCMRYNDRDTVIIRTSCGEGSGEISVAGIFNDGMTVRELYTGRAATVSGSAVRFPVFGNGVAILKKTEDE